MADLCSSGGADKFRRLFDGIRHGVFYQRADGVLTDVNRAALEMSGLSREEFLALTPDHPEWRVIREDGTEMGPHDDPPAMAIRTGRPVENVLVGIFNRRRGAYSWFRVDATPEFGDGPDRPATGAVVTLYDETRAVGLARALTDRDAIYGAIVQQAADGIVLIQPSTLRFVQFNDSACTALGYSRDEFLALSLPDIQQPGDEGGVRARLAEIARAGGLVFESTHRRKDGSLRNVMVSARAVEVAGHQLTSAIWTDITERKRVEEQARELARFNRGVLDSLSAHICVIDEAGTILAVNEGWRSFGNENGLAGVAMSVGSNYLEICDRATGADAEVARRIADGIRAVASGDIHEFHSEYPCNSPTEERWFALRATRFNDDGPVRVVLAHTNISAHKHAEQQDRRSQKLEALGRLAGGIAHDFNNVLHAIGGNSQLIADALPPGHPAQASVEAVQGAAARAASLVRQILSFSSRSDSGREPMHLGPVVEEAVRLLRATLPAMVEIRPRIQPDVRPVDADATQIHQIVVNLVTNGAHAIGPTSGVIEIGLERRLVAADDVAPARVAPGDYAVLSVRDSGCGMNRETLDRIFDPFFTTKGPGVGTGLGLSVVHGLVTSHGGTILVDSRPGRGALFEVYLPASGGEVAAKEPAACPVQGGRNRRLLYVDDEGAIVSLAQARLGRYGFQVTGMTDPVEAVKRFREDPAAFDAVVTDLSMPRLSGLDVAKAVLEARPGTPVVLTSGYPIPGSPDAMETLGIGELVPKPHSSEQLVQALDRQFAKARGEGA